MKQEAFDFVTADERWDPSLKRYRIFLIARGEIEVYAHSRREAIERAEQENPGDVALRALPPECGSGKKKGHRQSSVSRRRCLFI
jgi:hypothetical protein